jgi:hypothetical protein
MALHRETLAASARSVNEQRPWGSYSVRQCSAHNVRIATLIRSA